MHSLAVQMLRMCSHAFLGCIDAFIGCAEVFEKGERLHAFIRCADVSLTRLCLEGVHAHVVMVAGVHWAPCMVALCCCAGVVMVAGVPWAPCVVARLVYFASGWRPVFSQNVLKMCSCFLKM